MQSLKEFILEWYLDEGYKTNNPFDSAGYARRALTKRPGGSPHAERDLSQSQKSSKPFHEQEQEDDKKNWNPSHPQWNPHKENVIKNKAGEEVGSWTHNKKGEIEVVHHDSDMSWGLIDGPKEAEHLIRDKHREWCHHKNIDPNSANAKFSDKEEERDRKYDESYANARS